MLKIVTLSQGAEKAGGGDILSGKSMIDQHQVIQGIPIEYVLQVIFVRVKTDSEKLKCKSCERSRSPGAFYCMAFFEVGVKESYDTLKCSAFDVLYGGKMSKHSICMRRHMRMLRCDSLDLKHRIHVGV